jgi:hypothetical protein
MGHFATLIQGLRSLPSAIDCVWRRQSVEFLCGILVSGILAAGTSGCGLYSTAASGGPPADVTVVQATDLGPIPTNPLILGRDGGYSALFQGYSVWLYGDTFLSKPNALDRTLISDSMSYTSDLNAQDGISGFQEQLDSAGLPAMILPETAAEMSFNQAHNVNNCTAQPCGARWALWPSSVVVNPSDGSALIFYMVVYALPGSYNFQGFGSSVAVWQNLQAQPQRPVLNPPIVPEHPDLLFSASEASFGSASFINNGTLYAYGCDYNSGCQLGRVDPASAQDRSAWSFYAGGGNWSTVSGDGVAVFSDASILSVSWNNYLQRYLAVYSPPFSQNVVMRTSVSPEGPWSSEIVAFVAMNPAPGNGNVYDAIAHAEYDANGGQTIYVSYSRAMPTPFSSQVRLVAVELMATGAASQ